MPERLLQYALFLAVGFNTMRLLLIENTIS